MRSPFLWVVGLLLLGVAAYWLTGKVTEASAQRDLREETSPKTHPLPPPQDSPSPLTHSVDSSQSPPQKPAHPPSSPKRDVPKLESLFSLDRIAARSGLSCELVRHTYYELCYVEAHEQPAWTAYILEGKKLKSGHLRRTQDFREDPQVRTHSATLADYRHSGYDRGHLVPAGDFKWDAQAMSETFYLSNMSPQQHEFNAGIWEAIERTVRSWAEKKGRLVVYTGPVLRPSLPHIGQGVSVPDSFYKVIYALEGTELRAVAFLVPHRPFPENALSRFMVPVDVVEKVTGIDFFPELPDNVEEKAERSIEQSFWPVRFTKR